MIDDLAPHIAARFATSIASGASHRARRARSRRARDAPVNRFNRDRDNPRQHCALEIARDDHGRARRRRQGGALAARENRGRETARRATEDDRAERTGRLPGRAGAGRGAGRARLSTSARIRERRGAAAVGVAGQFDVEIDETVRGGAIARGQGVEGGLLLSTRRGFVAGPVGVARDGGV